MKRARVVALVGLVVVALGVGVAVFVIDDGDSSGPGASGPLHDILRPRFIPATVWAGDRLLVFGGSTYTLPGNETTMRSDRALVDPTPQ